MNAYFKTLIFVSRLSTSISFAKIILCYHDIKGHVRVENDTRKLYNTILYCHNNYYTFYK